MMEFSLAKPLSRKPLKLKDYLLDDLSSCSSSGFRSYPRRQCCTTVRFLLEIDLETKPPKYKKTPLLQNPLKPASATSISAFRRASETVMNAVRHFPFASLKSSTPSSSKLKLGILPRSLSRKLLKHSFWKKNDHKEIQRWKPVPINNHLTEEKSSPPPDLIITAAGDSSNSSTSESNSKSNSWSDSDFTTSDDSLPYCSTANSSASKIREEVVIENNKKGLPKDEVVSSKRVGVTDGGADDSMDVTTSSNSSTNSNSPNTTKRRWPNEGKEQFSPVSVLDYPFEDDDEEVSSPSPFQRGVARVEGTKKRLMKKIIKFERLMTQLEPVNLVKRIALSESDQESNESPLHHSSESIQDDFVSVIEKVAEEDKQAEEKPLKLLELIKCTMPSTNIKPNVEQLLLDFFKMGLDNSGENVMGLTTKGVHVAPDDELLHIAKDWLNGQPIEQLLEWEVKRYKEAYIRDMERGGEWRNLDTEKQEVALEIEVEVFASLMNDLLDDVLFS